MLAHIQQTLPVVVGQVTQRVVVICGALPMVLFDRNELMAESLAALENFPADLSRILPSFYGLNIASEVNTGSYLELFSEIQLGEEATNWWKDTMFSLWETFNVIGTGHAAKAWNDIKFAERWFGKTRRTLMLQSIFGILTHEKLFWLGIRDIPTKEIPARAVIDVLKHAVEIDRILDKAGFDVSGGAENFERVLGEMVERMRSSLRITES